MARHEGFVARESAVRSVKAFYYQVGISRPISGDRKHDVISDKPDINIWEQPGVRAK